MPDGHTSRTSTVFWTMESVDADGHVWTQEFTDGDGFDGSTDVSEVCREAEYEFDRGIREVTIRRGAV